MQARLGAVDRPPQLSGVQAHDAAQRTRGSGRTRWAKAETPPEWTAPRIMNLSRKLALNAGKAAGQTLGTGSSSGPPLRHSLATLASVMPRALAAAWRVRPGGSHRPTVACTVGSLTASVTQGSATVRALLCSRRSTGTLSCAARAPTGVNMRSRPFAGRFLSALAEAAFPRAFRTASCGLQRLRVLRTVRQDRPGQASRRTTRSASRVSQPGVVRVEATFDTLPLSYQHQRRRCRASARHAGHCARQTCSDRPRCLNLSHARKVPAASLLVPRW